VLEAPSSPEGCRAPSSWRNLHCGAAYIAPEIFNCCEVANALVDDDAFHLDE
jgi:hypothetical protein